MRHGFAVLDLCEIAMKKVQTIRREPITGLTIGRLAGLVGPDGRLRPGVMPADCNLADPRSIGPLFRYRDARYFAECIAPNIPHLREVRVNSEGPVLFRATHLDSGDMTYRQQTLVHQTTGVGPAMFRVRS